MDLGEWLRSLGLEQYEAAFRVNEIDDAVLRSLRVEDLKDLGVTIVGHRRKLLDAIAALRADAGLKPPPPEAVPPIGKTTTDTAERRQLTVMSCDLVGSTTLSARLDPEDMREIVCAYQGSCTEQITKVGGFVAKYMGNRVLACFGYPQAYEDDAQRAVRAGLALVAAVADLKTHASLQTRVGIATGPVAIGDLMGSGTSHERSIVDATPNLAAALHGIAEPNCVVIAESTRKHLGDLFELEDLGSKYLKGIARPVRTWSALGPASGRSSRQVILDRVPLFAEEQKAAEAERELQRTINHIPVLVATYRADGSRLYINQRVREFTGAADLQLGQMAMHPDDVELADEKWRACVASGEQFELEFRLRMADGTYRWHLNRRVPLRDETGKITRWYGVGYDIEDRKRAEEQLRCSEAFLAKAQRLSVTGSFSFYSATGEFTWSDELYRIFEFKPSRRVSLELVRTRYHPEDRQVLDEVAEGIRRGALDFDYEHRLIMPDRSIKHIRVVAQGTPDKSGNGLEYFGAVQDITLRRVAEAALDKARSELALANRVATLGQLTASIAHEVNQPIAAAVINAQAALRCLHARPPNLEGVQHSLTRIVRDATRAGNVVGRIRDLVKKTPPHRESVDMNEAVREVIELTRAEAVKTGVSIKLELAEGLPPIRGDRVQLQQVALNLIVNAVQAMEVVGDGMRDLFVATAPAEPDGVVVMVKDSGPGLEMGNVERVFDPFYSTKPDGLGIGLSICRSIIEAHQGRLSAAANQPRGAVFQFIVPSHGGAM
jgi:PAS domain S-box-containing protein